MEQIAYPGGFYYQIQCAQLEKCKGELRALVALNYDPAKGNRSERYAEIKKLVDCMIEELDNVCGRGNKQ